MFLFIVQQILCLCRWCIEVLRDDKNKKSVGSYYPFLNSLCEVLWESDDEKSERKTTLTFANKFCYNSEF